MSGLTPFQTVGPFFEVLLRTRVPCRQVSDDTPGTRISIEGTLYDGASVPIPDGLIEIWHADANGEYTTTTRDFSGYGWSATGSDGVFRFDTLKPGRVLTREGEEQAPHILVSVLARGVLTRYVTRLYFEDEPANERDPILALVPAARRPTLIARRVRPSTYCFDIRVQGADETVFFDV